METVIDRIAEFKTKYGNTNKSNIKKFPIYDDITKFGIINNIKNKWSLLLYRYVYNIIDTPNCLECDNTVSFIDSISGYRKYCTRKCMVNSDYIKNQRKKTCIKKYGVDNPSKNEKIKESVKKTNNEKFGVDYPMMSENIKVKSKLYFKKEYGVDNPSNVPEVQKKRTKTMMERYGVNCYTKTNEFIIKCQHTKLNNHQNKNYNNREKAMETMMYRYGHESFTQTEEYVKKSKYTSIERYGKEYYTQTSEYRKRINDIIFYKNIEYFESRGYKMVKYINNDLVNLKCLKCGDVYEITKQLFRKRHSDNDEICINCNPITSNTSKQESEMCDFIANNYQGEVIRNYRHQYGEIDFYLPEEKIGFEFNGLYWHSSLFKPRNYHQQKSINFKSEGIHLIHIWEDDWLFKSDIIKSRILNLLKMSVKIYARKCIIKYLNKKESCEFLQKNHLQGNIGSKVKIGLYHQDELVSLMTLGGKRISTGLKNKENEWEMLRFCNKIGHTVVGGASKLIKFFLKNHKCYNIISYADASWSQGHLYESIGFVNNGITDPNYYYFKNKRRLNRFSFRKDKLVENGHNKEMTEREIMESLKYYRIYDSGSYKFEITPN